MKAYFTALSLALAPVVAQAGDPCPIPVNVVDLGAPSWLDRDQLLADLSSQQSWIGIQHRDTPQGIVLTQVYAQSPAAASGLQEGDLITAINGVSTLDVSARDAVLNNTSIGDTLTFDRFSKPTATVDVGRTDPVPLALTNTLRRQDCRTSEIRVMDPQERTTILPLLFNPNRSFRCDDGHVALQSLGERYEIADVYFVRGSRRLLLSMPYWGSTCLIAGDFDGAGLTEDALLDAIEAVIGDYIQDSHDNP